MSNTNFGSHAVGVALCISRLLGYVREAYIASVFGAGANTDAYVAPSLFQTVSCMLAAGSSV